MTRDLRGPLILVRKVSIQIRAVKTFLFAVRQLRLIVPLTWLLTDEDLPHDFRRNILRKASAAETRQRTH
jgi:hypothetical protein